MLELCRLIVEYAERGDPVKDVIQDSQWSEDEVLRLLAEHYLATVKERE